MKNILAENMRRFKTKNLNEQRSKYNPMKEWFDTITQQEKGWKITTPKPGITKATLRNWRTGLRGAIELTYDDSSTFGTPQGVYTDLWITMANRAGLFYGEIFVWFTDEELAAKYKADYDNIWTAEREKRIDHMIKEYIRNPKTQAADRTGDPMADETYEFQEVPAITVRPKRPITKQALETLDAQTLDARINITPNSGF